MTQRKITPEAFNESAWNLGMPFRWNDLNHNGAREDNEVSTLTAHPFADVFLADGTKEKALQIIDEAATGKHLQVVRTPKYIQSLDKKIEALQSGSAPELLRQALRDRDMAYRSWTKHTIDFLKLSEGEQKAAWIFLQEVVPAVEAVYAIQTDPNNLKYFGEIAAQGSTADYLHAWYSGGPWCQEVKDEMCTSHPEGVPARVPNAGQWPESYTREEVAKLEANLKQEPEKNLLSDFVYRSLNQGKLTWSSVNAQPTLRPYLQTISAGLRKAAAVEGIDPSLKKFFEIRAGEFERTDSPFPFFDGDVAWVNLKGGLDVTLGFYESYKSPFEHTALIQSLIGPVDPEKQEMGHRFQALVPGMEQGIAEFLGSAYTPRDFSKGYPPLKFTNLTVNGDARIYYVPAAYQLPNVSPYGDSSIYKKNIIPNNIVARLEGVMKPMGNIVIHPSQRNITIEDMSVWVVGHENAHGVGVTPDLDQGLGKYAQSIEEAKGDMQGMASLSQAIEKKIVSKEQADKACIVQLYALLRALSYGMNDDHGVGSFIEFTSLYKDGAIVEKEGFYAVNNENGLFYKAAEKVARRIEKIQFESIANADKAKAELEAWLEESRRDLPERMKKYVTLLEKMPRDIFPWYSFKFSPAVEREMLANGGQFSKRAAR